MKRAMLVAFVMLLSVQAAGGTRDPSVADSSHLDYGAKFRCVVKVRTRRSVDGVNQFASGVVVSRRDVVTAAHVVEGTDNWGIILDGQEVPISGVAVHPRFDTNRIGHNDLAVARLARDVTLDFYPSLYGGDGEVGEVASIAGYGITGTFATGGTVSDGRLRAGSNVIDRVEGGMLICSTPGGRKTALEFLIAPGDSGGGLFIGNELAGIHSVIMHEDKSPPTSRYGDESGHTRVTLHRRWIQEQIDCE